MKRQMQRQPSSPSQEATPSVEPAFASSRTTFAPKLAANDPILAMPPSASLSSSPNLQPIQLSPLDSLHQSSEALAPTWRSDKNLTSLPDDEALLLDKEALFDPSIHLPYAPQDWKGYEPATPLSDFILQRIGVSGRPITTAEYMRHALTHPQFGYYTNPPKTALEKALQSNDEDEHNDDDFDRNDWETVEATTVTEASSSTNDSTLIGPGGDFVTAPEVSHVFGHCIGVWFVTQWQQSLQKPSKIQLVELGPGRGTLMADLLQLATSSKLQDFGQAIQVVHLVEASPDLRDQQEQALWAAIGHHADLEFVHVTPLAAAAHARAKATKEGEGASPKERPPKKFQIRIEWHQDFRSVQKHRNSDWPIFMVLQEFLDALPVHVFQKTEEGWRERMVDVVSVLEEAEEGKETNGKTVVDAVVPNPKKLPRLRQVLAPGVTAASELFMEPNSHLYEKAPVGSVVEICPEAVVLAQDMAQVLEESKGVALMIDYGQDGTSDTLRAFSKHKQVPLTSYPGQVDVTADVDFYALRQAVEADRTPIRDTPEEALPVDRKIHAFGPITQGEFLMRMGASDMVIHSIEQEETTPEQALKLTEALKYLVLPEHMGERYKVLALAPKREGIFAPAGMEG